MLTLTTCRTYPHLPPSLLPLAGWLAAHGIGLHVDAWQNHPATPFLLPLCAWDYAAAPQQFADWLAAAQAKGQRFVNPPDLMRWNMDKQYLLDLAAWGVDVIPSVRVPSESAALHTVLQRQGWQEAVLKPPVGQSGRAVVKIRAGREEPDWRLYPQGVMVQPYLPEIETGGEWSMVFFNGCFSHAVRRQPPPGEWRANSAYGVQILPLTPPQAALDAATATLRRLPERAVYARVDGVWSRQRFVLNELELIEPALYLDQAEGAAERFAQVLADVVAGR